MTKGNLLRPETLFDGYAFDLDGTVYLGDVPLPGAIETVARIRQAGRPVVFVTNNPLYSAEEYARKLRDCGIDATTSDLVTATDALVSYLSSTHPTAQLLVVGEGLLRRTLAAAGFLLTDEPSTADAVVVSFDRTFDYAKLHAAYQAVRLHGAYLVATNPDPYCPTPEGGLPDCAAMLAAIEACTNTTAEAIVGKPSHHMAAAVLERLGVSAPGAVMVGDRLATDMVMARDAGMMSVLVLTGATSPSDLEACDPHLLPDYVIQTLADLLPEVSTREDAGPAPQVRNLERA
ncbi:MAG TPA: HAD-IIA family hydrolase [Acidimicrobiales bacterium]|nr:HAD-IIA family hydrolase [Acidimicrobiales bacterium]